MIRADLHVHSKASRRPSEWFLQKVGAQESYTDIDTLYASAKARGMDFVTVTDHNTIDGALELVEKYPEDTFISVETTTYFPENRCKIHLLLFDITPDQFDRISAVRQDIYQLRELVREEDIVCSVAHGFYSVNNRLNLDILEKLILLFDVFEGLNGARNRYFNRLWLETLDSLTPETIQLLQEKHGIDPMSDDPWIKGITGGSDDHAGLFIGQTATTATVTGSKHIFLQYVRNKKTRCTGRCNDYKSFAFSIYKIFCQYSADAGKNTPGGLLSFINSVVFEERQSRLKQWLTLRKVKKGKQIKDKIILKFIEDVYDWSHHNTLDVEKKFDNIYKSMGLLLDEFFRMLLDSFVKDFSKGDINRLFRNLMSSFPAFFISIPFFSSLSHLSRDRALMIALRQKYNNKNRHIQKKVLWFTDTLNDLNGVSVTLENFCSEGLKRQHELTFVTCCHHFDNRQRKNSKIIYLPGIYSVTPGFYTSFTLNFPSLLASMEIVYQQQPDRIVISTPGPVGLLGMVMGHLMGLECVLIYHTDFSAQASWLFKDEELTGLVRFLVNRFYSFGSQIRVPTQEYIRILEAQGYKPEQMRLFRRGITVPEKPMDPVAKKILKDKMGICGGTTLLWAGRMSGDKNVKFLISVYHKALKICPDLNLILCGAGPDEKDIKAACRNHDRVFFMGCVPNDELMNIYEIADLFVFPSTTDTFGMVILEAQSRGLPALVTDSGGPKEIIEDGHTGHVLCLSDEQSWVREIIQIHEIKKSRPNEYFKMKEDCRRHVRRRFSWDNALDDIMDVGVPVSGGQNTGLLEPAIPPAEEAARGVA